MHFLHRAKYLRDILNLNIVKILQSVEIKMIYAFIFVTLNSENLYVNLFSVLFILFNN